MSENNSQVQKMKLGSHSLPVSISDVVKTYGSVAALGGVSLDIQSGEFMTLLGPSGSGKTTLLMVLAGFIRPDSGSVKFGEKEVVLKAPHLRGVGMMFQNYALFPHMSVGANVAYPLKIRGMAPKQREAEVARVLATVQLEGYESRRISELSGGQRQRVALARAIVFKPKILLMDEPLSALDKNLREDMQLELRAMHEQLGMTTVLVTHDQREALTMSDRIAVLSEGELRQVDNAETLYNRPNSEFVASFMGESCFLNIELKEGEYFYHGRKLKTDGIGNANAKNQLLVVRPEKIEFVNDKDSNSELNCFDGVLENLLFQGDSILGFIRLESGELIQVRRNVRQSNSVTLPNVGDKIVIGLHQQETRVVARDVANV